MVLVVYEETSPGVYEAFSIGGLFTNPIVTTHHGRDGDTFEQKLYLGRAVGSVHSYTNIQLQPVSLTAEKDIDPNEFGASGWGIKTLLDTGSEPNETDWAAVDYGAVLDFTDIASDSKQAFWFRIESPRGIRVGNKRNISLLVMFTETA